MFFNIVKILISQALLQHTYLWIILVYFTLIQSSCLAALNILCYHAHKGIIRVQTEIFLLLQKTNDTEQVL